MKAKVLIIALALVGMTTTVAAQSANRPAKEATSQSQTGTKDGTCVNKTNGTCVEKKDGTGKRNGEGKGKKQGKRDGSGGGQKQGGGSCKS